MMNDRKDKNLDSMEASSPVTRPRESLQGQCQHCHDKSHLTSEPVFESPFKGMSRILLAFKSVGIFNFTIHDDFTEFECNPHLIFYALFLNLLVLAIPIGLQVMWIVYLPQGVTYEVILEKVNQSFSSTDFVAVVGLLALIQLSSLWLQLTNISACGNLNDLVNGVRALGVVDGYDGVIQNPKCTKQTYLFLLIAMIIVSFTLISSVIPEILGLSIDRLFDLVFGFAIAIAICYLHLPQLLSEFLFLRFMTVLEYHFEHLLGHIDCCMVHKGAFMVKPDRLKQTACCLDHCNGLIKLHRTIEETFSRQLLILFGLIMGSLIFSLYLSITFIISYKSWFHGLFIIGCFVFSLVPAGRLYFLGSSVNQVIKKVSEVKQRLYMIESFSTRELDVQGKVRCTIRKYSEITGFSADNYFVVNNAMVTSILGYLTTYLIVLVQFKIAERSHA